MGHLLDLEPHPPSSNVKQAPIKNVRGPKCIHYHKPQKFSEAELAIAAINKYFKAKPQESIVICTNEDDENFFCETLREKFGNERKIYNLPYSCKQPNWQEDVEKVKQFIKNPEGGILVTNHYNFMGAQARNMIIFVDKWSSNRETRDAVLRAMSFAILIHTEHDTKENPYVERDTDLHKFIDSKNHGSESRTSFTDSEDEGKCFTFPPFIYH